MIIDNKHYINAIKLHGHLLVLDGIYVTICWTSDDCDGQVDLKLHLSVGQVILFPYFDHWFKMAALAEQHQCMLQVCDNNRISRIDGVKKERRGRE